MLPMYENNMKNLKDNTITILMIMVFLLFAALMLK